MRTSRTTILAALAVAAFGATAMAQDAKTSRASENEVGRAYIVKPGDLPSPASAETVRNAPVIVPRGNAELKLPPGYQATLFASGLDGPRHMVILPNGDVILAMQKGGYLMLLRDADKDGVAEWIERFAGGFNAPYGLAWRDGEVLVADQDGIWRVPHKLTNVRASYGEPLPAAKVPAEDRKPQSNADQQTMLTSKGVFGDVIGHRNRDLKIGPDGRLYVGVGSGGNVGIEPPVKATVQSFSASGDDQQTVAAGMRNPTGIAFQPETGEMWASVQERDHLGNLLVPDYFTHVKPGASYGWPYTYLGENVQPEFQKVKDIGGRKPADTPDVLFAAHSAVMTPVFYSGQMFPADVSGDAFAALKGSWNRADPTGYKVVRIPFENGKPTGGYENFMTGFWVGGEDKAEVWGRPVDLAVAPDGALFVVDDTGGTVWRVTYAPPAR